ncbi:MAG: hypothetical protein M0R32_12370 [Candidatus Cloacimonetes bacterium]|jgi:hypothetical protein|nr:hypothetical protein [Candidatus Cloacimonadota bacterium]
MSQIPISLKQLESWSKLTFIQMLESSRNILDINPKQYELMLLELARDRRVDMTVDRKLYNWEVYKNEPVNGWSCQGWENNNWKTASFQKAYNTAVENYPGDWTPTEYLIEFFKDSLSMGQERQHGLGRAMRNLPSFFREYLLHALLEAQGCTVSIPTLEENLKEHADLYVDLSDRRITVWHYLDGPIGRENLEKKLHDRGKISKGLNLLAPMVEGQKTDYYGWWLPPKSWAAELIDICRNKKPLTWEQFNLQTDTYGFLPTFMYFEYP